MKIQVGDIVKVLGNQFLHTVLDLSECEIEEFNEVLVQRIDNTKIDGFLPERLFPWRITSEYY